MRLPIDTDGFTFLCAMAPEPVMDYETKRQKGDANGEPLFAVQLVLLADGGAEVISVKVAGQPHPALGPGVSVMVNGLVATPWAMNDRSGVAFRATGITPIQSAAETPKSSSGSDKAA